MARARSIAFSAATIAACLLCAWPVTIEPPAQADHFHIWPPIFSTTAYSIPRYCKLSELIGAGFRSHPGVSALKRNGPSSGPGTAESGEECQGASRGADYRTFLAGPLVVGPAAGAGVAEVAAAA
jgi:hypothetical protein